MSSYTPDQIDDVNLAYHYNKITTDSRGVYYQLKTGAPGFPASFWAFQRSQQAPSSSQQVHQPTASTTSNYRQKVVSTFRVVAHTMGPLVHGGAVSQNHWTIYLIVPGGSVQLNMKTSTDPNTRRGIFEVRERAYEKSNTAVRWFDLPATNGLLVNSVEREIRSQRWDQYDMTEGGVGCRWWILTVMRGFANKGFVDGKKVESELVPALSYNYSKDMEPIWLEIKQGTFC